MRSVSFSEQRTSPVVGSRRRKPKP